MCVVFYSVFIIGGNTLDSVHTYLVASKASFLSQFNNVMFFKLYHWKVYIFLLVLYFHLSFPFYSKICVILIFAMFQQTRQQFEIYRNFNFSFRWRNRFGRNKKASMKRWNYIYFFGSGMFRKTYKSLWI